MQIIIVGAGLGGLSAAVCFAKRGHQVKVLERRAGLSPRGGGIAIRPGASRILHSWGLEPELEAIATATPTVLVRSVRTGDITTKSIISDVSEYPDWGTTREELIAMFYEVAVHAGCEVQFGVSVTDVCDRREQKQPLVQLDKGEQLGADLVIVADGVASRLRDKILADATVSTKPVASYMALHGVQIPVSKLKERPGTSRLYDQANINTWIDADRFVVTHFDPRRDRVGMAFCFKTETIPDAIWTETGSIEELRQAFKGSCIELETALNLAQACSRWQVVELPHLPRWTSKTGRAILLGDCAHAMHSSAAQGYSQIVEDIGVLDVLLQLFPPRTHLSTITSAWQDIRKPRAERAKDFAKWNTEVFTRGMPLSAEKQASKPPRVAQKSLKNVKPDEKAAFNSSAFLKWIMNYDAVYEAKQWYEAQAKAKL